MAEFLAAFASGHLTGLDEHAKLAFTAPAKADKVKISVFIAPEWRPHDDWVAEKNLRAEILGKIVAKKFVFESTNTYYDMAVGKDGKVTVWGWVLSIDIDGHECHVPLPRLQKNHEHGYFEVTFSVDGLIDGKSSQYETKSALFCRALFDTRAVLAFLAGKPDDLSDAFTKAFFPQAARVWRTVTDRDPSMLSFTSLRGILGFVTDPKRRARRNGLPIGEVNIVAHGNGFEWLIRVEEGSKRINRVDVAMADELIAGTLPVDPDKPNGETHPNLPMPGAEDLDEQSLVILRGCELGWNRPLLQRIFVMFGGRAAVYGCYCTIKYRDNQETLLDEFDFSLPGTGHGADEIKSQIEKKREKAKAAGKGAPDYSDYTQKDWDELEATTVTDTDAFVHRSVEEKSRHFSLDKDTTFNEPTVHDASGAAKSQKELEQIAKDHWVTDSTGWEFDDFAWGAWTLTQASPKKDLGGGQFIEATYRLDSVGKRTAYSYRRAVFDPDTGKPAISDIRNPRHFRMVQSGP